MYFKWFLLVILLCFGEGLLSEGLIRQKRCIVVQKQSGTHGDSTEGEEDRRPEIKDKRPDRRQNNFADFKRTDAEEIPQELLKYKIVPTKLINNDIQRLRKRYRHRY